MTTIQIENKQAEINALIRSIVMHEHQGELSLAKALRNIMLDLIAELIQMKREMRA